MIEKPDEKPAEEDVCKKCRYWRPRVLTDSLGMIRGCHYCFCRNPRADHQCFEPLPEEEPKREKREENEG